MAVASWGMHGGGSIGPYCARTAEAVDAQTVSAEAKARAGLGRLRKLRGGGQVVPRLVCSLEQPRVGWRDKVELRAWANKARQKEQP